MSALPVPRHLPAPISSQDQTYDRVRGCLETMTTSLLHDHPELEVFEEIRPPRDRSSGTSWNGLRTTVHVSCLFISSGALDLPAGYDLEEVGAALDPRLRAIGLQRRDRLPGPSIAQLRWQGIEGDVSELLGARRLAVRVISAPFLPGTLDPAATSSPVTPPPRPIR